MLNLISLFPTVLITFIIVEQIKFKSLVSDSANSNKKKVIGITIELKLISVCFF